MIALILAALACAIWACLLLARGGFWHESPAAVDAPAGWAPAGGWPDVVAVIPARDEAAGVGTAVASLLGQDYPGRFAVVLVDDHSRDGTAERAQAAAHALGRAERLTVVPARALPSGWTGKLWAVAEGLARSREVMPEARYVLLTDADIAHADGSLAGLVARAEAGGLDLVSLMVRLHCRSLAERVLIPAFVFFFQLLYPFAWVNDPRRPTAAAAGGCMLVRRRALERIGGVAPLRGALIDDCAIARAIKAGGPIWLDLTVDTVSLRAYQGFGDIGRMIARSAYTQLKRSPLLLGLTVAGMTITYLVPPVLALRGLVVVEGPAGWLGAAAWAAMTIAYLPAVRRHGLAPRWAALLPLAALFYLGATVESARRHWAGRGGEWKGRVQAPEAGA